MNWRWCRFEINKWKYYYWFKHYRKNILNSHLQYKRFPKIKPIFFSSLRYWSNSIWNDFFILIFYISKVTNSNEVHVERHVPPVGILSLTAQTVWPPVIIFNISLQRGVFTNFIWILSICSNCLVSGNIKPELRLVN